MIYFICAERTVHAWVPLLSTCRCLIPESQFSNLRSGSRFARTWGLDRKLGYGEIIVNPIRARLSISGLSDLARPGPLSGSPIMHTDCPSLRAERGPRLWRDVEPIDKRALGKLTSCSKEHLGTACECIEALGRSRNRSYHGSIGRMSLSSCDTRCAQQSEPGHPLQGCTPIPSGRRNKQNVLDRASMGTSSKFDGNPP